MSEIKLHGDKIKSKRQKKKTFCFQFLFCKSLKQTAID